MKKFFITFFVSRAKYHIYNANEMGLLKSKNLVMYGKDYSKSFGYKIIDLSEEFHFIMFNIYNSFI